MEILETLPSLFGFVANVIRSEYRSCVKVEVAVLGLSVLLSLTVSVDVKQHWTMLRHWSQFVPNNMSTDIRGHVALLHHHHHHHHRVVRSDLHRMLMFVFHFVQVVSPFSEFGFERSSWLIVELQFDQNFVCLYFLFVSLVGWFLLWFCCCCCCCCFVLFLFCLVGCFSFLEDCYCFGVTS